jgi:hypothetical protein
MKLSIRVYPRSKSIDESFQRLLTENILPLASRRCPHQVDAYINDPAVAALFDYYCDALESIFQFYATADARSSRALVNHAVAAGTAGTGYGPFGATTTLTTAGRSPGRATRASNSMKEALGYHELLKFASDFDLSNSVILSTLEIGDIYLSSIKSVQPDSTIRKLNFPEFWEVLIRCALIAYSKISDSTILDKIRGLFLYMWRSMNQAIPRAFNERRNVSTYAGDLLAGAMLFNKRFTAQWAADGHRDYLSPEVRPFESGKTVLARLMMSNSSSLLRDSSESEESPSKEMQQTSSSSSSRAFLPAASPLSRSDNFAAASSTSSSSSSYPLANPSPQVSAASMYMKHADSTSPGNRSAAYKYLGANVHNNYGAPPSANSDVYGY